MSKFAIVGPLIFFGLSLFSNPNPNHLQQCIVGKHRHVRSKSRVKILLYLHKEEERVEGGGGNWAGGVGGREVGAKQVTIIVVKCHTERLASTWWCLSIL